MDSDKSLALKEARELKKATKHLSLVKNMLSPQQALFVLQKTPREHIYTRPGKGGGQFEYVTGTYIKKILNYTFGWMWDFEIKDKGREGNQVWILGRLTIKNPKGEPMVVKEQFGRADIKFKRDSKEMVDYGNDLKAATTDALKKCAAELGIASDVYGKNEFKEIKDEKGKFQSGESVPTAPKEDRPELKKLVAELAKRGATNKREAIEMLNQITDAGLSSINEVDEASAKRYLGKVLMAKSQE